MTTDLDTLITALYVKIDDDLAGIRRVGRPPQLTDSELVCLAVARPCSATPPIRVAQRILAMAAAIWHNNKTSQPISRSPGH